MGRERKTELRTEVKRKFLSHQWQAFKKRWLADNEKGSASPVAREIMSHFEFINGQWLVPRSEILRVAKGLIKDAPVDARILPSKIHNECLTQLLDELDRQRTKRFFQKNPSLKPAAPLSPDVGDNDYQVRTLNHDEFYRFAFIVWCSLQFYLRSEVTKETLFAGRTNKTPFLWQEAERMTRVKLNFNGPRGDYGIIQRTIRDRNRWRESVHDKITDLASYSDEEITRLAIVCLKDVQDTVQSYMRSKINNQSFDKWLQERKCNQLHKKQN